MRFGAVPAHRLQVKDISLEDITGCHLMKLTHVHHCINLKDTYQTLLA